MRLIWFGECFKEDGEQSCGPFDRTDVASVEVHEVCFWWWSRYLHVFIECLWSLGVLCGLNMVINNSK